MTNRQRIAAAREEAEREAYLAGARDAVRHGLEELREYLQRPDASVAELLSRVAIGLEAL